MKTFVCLSLWLIALLALAFSGCQYMPPVSISSPGVTATVPLPGGDTITVGVPPVNVSFPPKK